MTKGVRIVAENVIEKGGGFECDGHHDVTPFIVNRTLLEEDDDDRMRNINGITFGND